jgi:hypothetical protein
MTGHARVNMAYHDFHSPPPPWPPQRTNSKTTLPNLLFLPLATMRCVTTTLRRTHHDLPHNRNHTSHRISVFELDSRRFGSIGGLYYYYSY